ncbi:hypothetical protein QJQ45_003193 [Haematococcus lacustris]|nr:hypothetical protein QJQ45_003193 [Haematococcus lacustris]
MLAQLRREVGISLSVQRLVDALEQGIASRAAREQELAGQVANKDAEAARLRAEINRLRQAHSASDKLSALHAADSESLQSQVRQLESASKWHAVMPHLLLHRAAERAAILSAAIPAAASPSAQLHRLQAEVDAQAQLVARLQAELGAQLASSTARAAELQDSFAAKVADMRRAHAERVAALEQQLAAAVASKATEQGDSALRQTSKTQSAELLRLQADAAAQHEAADELRAELARLHHQLDASRRENATLSAKVAAQEAELSRLTKAVTAAEAQAAEHAARAQELNTQLMKRSSHEGKGGGSMGGGGGAPGPPNGCLTDMSNMVAMMEGQLARLSDLIRTKDREVADLRGALTAGCEERRDLMQQLQAAELQQQQQQGGSAAAAGPRSPGSVGMGAPHSPTGVRQAAVASAAADFNLKLFLALDDRNSAVGASGSGQQVQGQGQAVKVVIAERRQNWRIGKEYQQGYKRVNDRLPKGRQWLHRAAEYRRGIDGRARNNA